MDTRKVADCRLMPSDSSCSITIAGLEDEIVPLAAYHAVEAHGHEDGPDLRAEIKKMLVDE